MTDASYIARLVRPDVELFRSPPRSWFGRLFHARADRALRRLCDPATYSTPDAQVEAALAWQYRFVLPVSRGSVHGPAPLAGLLACMEADCDEGAVLLASLLKATLPYQEHHRLRLCVGGYPGAMRHVWLRWLGPDCRPLNLDWTQDSEPFVALHYPIDSEEVLV